MEVREEVARGSGVVSVPSGVGESASGGAGVLPNGRLPPPNGVSVGYFVRVGRGVNVGKRVGFAAWVCVKASATEP